MSRDVTLVRPDGYRSWWRNGKLHRDDGPAIERPDGSCEWWVDGERIDDPAEGERPSL